LRRFSEVLWGVIALTRSRESFFDVRAQVRHAQDRDIYENEENIKRATASQVI